MAVLWGAEYCVEEYLGVGFLNIFTSVDPVIIRPEQSVGVSYSFCEIRSPLWGAYQNRHRNKSCSTMVPNPTAYSAA